MRSPFPGMDPFIESRGLWGDFHDSLIAEIKRNLANALPERYVVRISERSYIDYINPREAERTTIPMKPDVTLHSTSAALETASQLAGTALAEEDPQSLIMHGLVEVEERETFLEIRELDPELRLVTCIEVLSPSNKRYGSVGWYQYQQKRQVFVQGHANLVELDLLRAGRRMPMEEPWQDSPYFLTVFRKDQAPGCRVRPVQLREPLPALAIPLAPPDPDQVINLQAIIDEIYTRSRYARQIDYARPLRPPLTAPEAEWLQQQLHSPR